MLESSCDGRPRSTKKRDLVCAYNALEIQTTCSYSDVEDYDNSDVQVAPIQGALPHHLYCVTAKQKSFESCIEPFPAINTTVDIGTSYTYGLVSPITPTSYNNDLGFVPAAADCSSDECYSLVTQNEEWSIGKLIEHSSLLASNSVVLSDDWNSTEDVKVAVSAEIKDSKIPRTKRKRGRRQRLDFVRYECPECNKTFHR